MSNSTSKAKIHCAICNDPIHSVALHLNTAHPEITIEMYRELHPAAPLLSEAAKEAIAAKQAVTTSLVTTIPGAKKIPMSKVFGLKPAQCKSSRGGIIEVTVLEEDGEFSELIPDVDTNYVFVPEMLKNIIMGFERNIPTYLWGFHGTGKSSVLEQFCANTNRRYSRIQHTPNTEESHIVGQIMANAEGTYFQPGELALAMRYGFVYCADEYDRCPSSVLSVYQAVLEGKPLVIKEAPPEWRLVKPHPNFRFVATGNTNGAGDETGLYSSTCMGDAANYSRFGITINVGYMEPKIEAAMLMAKTGVEEEDAKTIVEFAKKIREAFASQKMSMTIGPRELVYSAAIGLMKGNFAEGIRLAFANRLNAVDQDVVSGIIQRVFDAPQEMNW